VIPSVSLGLKLSVIPCLSHPSVSLVLKPSVIPSVSLGEKPFVIPCLSLPLKLYEIPCDLCDSLFESCDGEHL
jgi:hypothetical protein